ncbi:hypothetical protein ACH3XW_12485 [Acanthocheilonema viteae]
MDCESNDILCYSSNLSEVKSTIGTSSLSSELTIVSFTDITVSSQESFDNDNIVLPEKTYSKITRKENLTEKSEKAIKISNQTNLRKKQSDCYKLHFAECFIACYAKLKLLKCACKIRAKNFKLEPVDSIIYEVIIEQTFAKLSSTAINISPKNITKLVLSNISLSSTISEGCTYPETFTDERTQKDSGTDNCISKNTQSKNKNSKKIIQKYYETTSKKVLIFNAFPETFRNRNGSIYSDIIIKWLEYMPSHVMINRVYNFDKMIESIKLIEQEISAIESVCLRKKLNMGDFATNESLQIDDEKSTVMNVSEMLNETLRTLNDLIIDVCKNNSNAES